MRPLIAVLLIVLLAAPACAQKSVLKFSLRLGSAIHPADQLQQTAFTTAWNALEELQVSLTDTSCDYVLYVDAKNIGDQTVVSLWLCHALPREAVAACAREEVFYASVSPERRAAFPPEGKWVREKVTSDFVRNFVMPLESRIVHAPPDRLEKALQEAIHSVIHPLVKP